MIPYLRYHPTLNLALGVLKGMRMARKEEQEAKGRGNSKEKERDERARLPQPRPFETDRDIDRRDCQRTFSPQFHPSVDASVIHH